LDLSGRARAAQFGGALADRLESVLAALGIKSYELPNDDSLDEFVLPDTQGHRLVLKRMPDGRYCFDEETVSHISRAWAEIQKSALGKSDTSDARPGFASPRATFRTFMKALRHGDSDLAVQCLDLRDVSPAARSDVGRQLAHRLKQFIDRTRLVVFQHIPDNTNGRPYIWLTQPNGLIDLARESSGERKGEWLFSAATVRSIDRLFADSEGRPHVREIRELVRVDPEPSMWREPELWLRGQMPAWARASVFTTRTIHVCVYELAGALLLVVSGIGLYVLVRSLAAGVVRSLLRLTGAKLPPATLRRRLRPMSVLICLLYIRYGVLLLALDKVLLAGALTVLNPLIWVCVAWVACRCIDLMRDVVEARMAANDRHVVASQMLMPVGALSLKIVILVGTLFHLMHLFDWQVTAILTGLGIGGLAFALGAQDSLKNLFGSFTLIADRPFIVGERVKIGQHGEGVVEVVGLRSTRIRTAEDAVLTVPNSDLTTMHITNYGRRRPCRFKTTLSIVHSTPPERLLAFRDRLRDLIRKRATTDKNKSTVAISDLVPSSVEVKIDVFFEAMDRGSEMSLREELILEILRLAESLRIEFASTTQMVHFTLPTAEPMFRPAGVSGSNAEAA
jgi:MscS family membrane protein